MTVTQVFSSQKKFELHCVDPVAAMAATRWDEIRGLSGHAFDSLTREQGHVESAMQADATSTFSFLSPESSTDDVYGSRNRGSTPHR